MSADVRLTRRAFLGGLITLVCAPPALSGCGDPAPAGSWPIPAGTVLSPARYATLSAAMDTLIPGDAASPGAVLCGAPYYLDQLLGAFRADPPRIFAGGPYSGRHGGEDGFSHFQPLNRVERIRWQTFLEGSLGRPEREWNGPVKGLLATLNDGLDALDADARDRDGAPFAALDGPARRAVITAADAEFVNLLYEYAVEGCYADPVYGGNQDGQGWTAIRFEGDRQPLGFTAAQMLHPTDGAPLRDALPERG